MKYALAATFLMLAMYALPADDAPDCHTDSECADLCADNDADCDGGPHG